MLAAGAALLVAAGVAWSAGSAEAPKGGTLRVGSVFDVDYVDPALSYEFGLEFATCAKLFNYPDASGAAGTRLIREVVKSYTVSRDGRTYDFELKRTFRFHTGAAVTAHSFAAAFNRDANPRLESPAKVYMREIVGAVAVMEGKAKAISGVRVLDRYRLRIRLTRPVGDFTVKLAMPFFCPIPPGTPIVPEGIDNPAGSGPYYVAERILNRQIVLKRNPFYGGGRPANVDQVVWTIGETAEACFLDVEEDRLDLCLAQLPNTALPRRLEKQYGINRPDGQFFRGPSFVDGVLRLQPRSAGVQGAGADRAEEGDQLRDRPAGAHPRLPPSPGTRTDQILPPRSAARRAAYPLGGADPATARKWSPGRSTSRRASSTTRPTTASGSTFAAGAPVQPEADRDRARRQVLRLPHQVREGSGLEVSRSTSPTTTGYPTWPDPAGFFEPLLDPDLPTTGNRNFSYFVRPSVTRRMEAASRLSGPARRKAWADLDADLMRNDPPWAPIVHAAVPDVRLAELRVRRPSPRSTASTSRPPARRGRWPAGSRSRSACWLSVRLCSLAAGVAWSAGSAEAPKGGTLGSAGSERRLRRSRRSPTSPIRGRSGSLPARSSSTIRTSGGSGHALVPEVVKDFHGLQGRPDVHVRAEANVPLPHGRAR